MGYSLPRRGRKRLFEQGARSAVTFMTSDRDTVDFSRKTRSLLTKLSQE